MRFLLPLPTLMDLIHESTTPEVGLRPVFIGFVERFVVVCAIPIDIATWRRSAAGRRFGRVVARYHQSGRAIHSFRQRCR
jgi:hypothetical protein